MAITLETLSSTGPEKSEARVIFRSPATLIRGPSDTGKSYVRDCLWFLLGGDKHPKPIPEATGYQTLTLTITSENSKYELRRAVAGGETSIYRLDGQSSEQASHESIDQEVNSFFVELAGAKGKQLLRSAAKKGPVTGGDLRHWVLLSQPSMISEEATSGAVVNATQRSAAFHLFLTGDDDAAIELSRSKSEADRLAGQAAGLEDALSRLLSTIPSDLRRDEVADSMERVDSALESMTEIYNSRAAALRDVRDQVVETSRALEEVDRHFRSTEVMIHRFEMLDGKYQSDAERLGATWEGVSMFQALDETSCPLCGTPAESQLDPRNLRHGGQEALRRALRVEIEKIADLRRGLAPTLRREQERFLVLQNKRHALREKLDEITTFERQKLAAVQVEFAGDPKLLAVRRSELSEFLARFDEIQRLIEEIERLKNLKKKKRQKIARNPGHASTSVSRLVKAYLHAWGFASIETVSLDIAECDLIIDGRRRLDYGAGKRSVFLAALAIAVMEHALAAGHPHPGFVVVDSPLKSYADPKNSDRDVPVATLTDRFYAWLAQWLGPGQIVILENQEASPKEIDALEAVEFTGEASQPGRFGFYPR